MASFANRRAAQSSNLAVVRDFTGATLVLAVTSDRIILSNNAKIDYCCNCLLRSIAKTMKFNLSIRLKMNSSRNPDLFNFFEISVDEMPILYKFTRNRISLI